MKKVWVGGLSLALVVLFAQAASPDPCGLCESFYPCDWPCEHCVEGNGGPGLWEIGGGCWGEIVPGTCGDTGNCGGDPSCTSTWTFGPVVEKEPILDEDAPPDQGGQSSPAQEPAAPATR